jgi:NAD-specific glutamate dehydrogenase
VSGRSTGGARGSTGSAVGSRDDGVGDALELLLLGLVLVLGGGLVGVEPADGLLDLGLELLLVGGLDGELALAKGVLERVGVRLEAVLGLDTGSLLLVLGLVLLGLGKHALDFLLGETALVVGDDNLVALASALLNGRDVHDTVGVHVEGDLDLGDTTRSGGDAGKLELAKQVVVLCASTLTLVDLDQDTGLVVAVGREGLGLLGGDGGVALDEGSHDTTGSLDTDGERSNVEKQDLVGGLGRSVTRQDGSLDGSTVGNGLVGVDGLVGLLVEEVADELLDLGDTGGTADQDNLVDGGLVGLGVAEDTLDGLHGGAEQVLAELLETSTGDGGVEVDTLEERVDFDGGLGRRGESALGTLASSAQTAESTGVGSKICE